MSTINLFEHPASGDATEMFVLRAGRDLWAEVLEEKVGDVDMAETDALAYSWGMHPQYHQHLHLVASDVATPTCVADVIGVATVELPMADNPRLATTSVVVRRDRRREGIGTALHAAALEVATQHQRSTVQAWTWEPSRVPDGARELPAETGSGSIEADSRESRFMTQAGWVLGQVERLSRLQLPPPGEVTRRKDEALAGLPADYELITMLGRTPVRLLAEVAQLMATMSSDVPLGAMDIEDETWDALRVRVTEDQLEAADREQLQTFVRHIPSGHLVGFTRLIRDRAILGVAHQWDTLVVDEHRGHGLGMLMKVVNHAAVGEFWPDTLRLITGNASENAHMLAINTALGYQPYAASGFWELRHRGPDA
ncbi:GNAT family N-acetyltransferase [Tessaracoccus sp.]